MKALLKIVLVAMSISAWGALVGCLPAAPQQAAETATKEKALNFANEERLDEHWRKHGLNTSEFKPPLSRHQYLEYARAFFASKAEDIETKKDRDGDTLRYRRSTNEFGVLAARGFIRTYFRPRDGARYWARQGQ